MSPIRFAILAAVSTEPQARDDKASLPSQIAACRKIIAQYGQETAGPYILDGYSRSGYDSLADAMEDIPPLKAAIADAQSNKYDILIVDNYDRFGDLAYMVGTRYKKLKKQIYSARQSGRVVPPEEYDPYADDSMSIHMHVGGIIQNYRINKIRRGYNIGIPARLDKGLHAIQIPDGYKSQGKHSPAIQTPRAAILRQMKDWLLEGATLGEIVQRANKNGWKTSHGKQWDITGVHRMLENPYYAGLLAYNKTSAKKRLPRSKWTIKRGAHQPLWDVDAYNAILAELDRRQQGRRKKQLHALSGICRCAECGAPMYRNGGIKHVRYYLSCQNHHPMIEYKTALALVAAGVSAAIHAEAETPSAKQNWDSELQTLNKQRARIQEGFEAGLYTAAEAHKKIIAVENSIDDIVRKKQELAKGVASRKVLLELAKQSPKSIERWILAGEPRDVNRTLHIILAGVYIKNKQIQEIKFR